ncbi:MAG: hypothetical protein AAF488_06605 [Planctomycetota bacterium]
MNHRIRSRSLYDVTREMRRLALSGRLELRCPDVASAVREALETGGRIVFSPDENTYFQEFDMDHVFEDPRTGRRTGVRKL